MEKETYLTNRERITYPINLILRSTRKASNTEYKKVKIWGTASQSETEMPKIIWMFWHDNSLPYLVNICKSEVERLNPNYKIYLLTKETVKNYLPNFLSDNLDMPIQKYANLLRLKLLIEYGGIWMDATSIPLKSFDEIFKIIDYNLHDVFLLKANYFTIDFTCPIFENWFIASNPHNKLLMEWYDKTYQSIINESGYIKSLDSAIIQRISDPIYLKMLVGLQQIMRSNQNYRVQYLSSFDFGFNYGGNRDIGVLDLRNAIKTLCFNKAPSYGPLFCKFTGSGYLLRQLIDYKLINPQSIIGKVLQKYKGKYWG